MQRTTTNSAYGAYGAVAQRAYHASGDNQQVFQTVRMLDSVLQQIEQAHVCDTARQIQAEYTAVELAVTVLRGLSAMIDRRQGRVAENLYKTYRGLIKALLGVCAMTSSQGQYLRLYDAVLGLRNAWASVCGVAFVIMPAAMAAEMAQNPPVTAKTAGQVGPQD